MTKPVPTRPNLEFDRKQAKALFKAYLAHEVEALERFASWHPRGRLADAQLTDAQLVVAREYGFKSWPQWRSFVETRNLTRQEQVAVALRAVCSNNITQARVLLQSDPELPMADVYLACACGEIETVRVALSKDPGLARRRGGVLGWTPLEYACFSRFLRAEPERAPDIVAVARLLLEHGADPNCQHSVEFNGSPNPEPVLYAAAGIANNAELTRLLLEAGADPDEQLPPPDPKDSSKSPWGPEALYHACEFRETACLELILKAGPHPIRVSYCLGRSLDFENPEAVRLFLAYGADPNFEYHGTFLHKAVKFGRSASIVEALLKAGADLQATDREGLTVYQWALRFGDSEVIAALEVYGASGGTEVDRLLGRIYQGEALNAGVSL